MPYTPTVWVNGGAPALSKANLDHLETQYDQAVADIPPTVRKTADQTVNNSNVLVNDNHLLFPVLANEVWTFDIRLRIQSTTVADFKYAYALPAGGDVKLHLAATAFDSDIADIERDNTNLGGLIAIGAAPPSVYVVISRVLYIGGANAGNVQLQWAQNTAEATDTKVLANSYIVAHNLS